MKSEDVQHIVLLSGGRDSTAMALRLQEIEPRVYTYLYTPTGNELPEMKGHFEKLSHLLGAPVQTVNTRTLLGLCLEHNTIPNYRMRFCTRILKIESFKTWLLSHMPAVGYIGLRADEAEREGITYEEEEIKAGLVQRYPLTEWEWGLSDIIKYLEHRGVTVPKRTDCALCFFQRLGEWWFLWRDYPEEFEKGVVIEEKVGHTFRSPSRDTWPAALADLKGRFEEGFVPRGVLKDKGGSFRENDRMSRAQCRICGI